MRSYCTFWPFLLQQYAHVDYVEECGFQEEKQYSLTLSYRYDIINIACAALQPSFLCMIHKQ